MAIKYLDTKRIQGLASALKPTLYTSDLSSASGWETDGSAISVNTSGSYIDSDNNGGGTTHQAISKDLGSNLATSWVIDFDIKFIAVTNGNSNWTHIGMSDSDQDVDDDDNQNFLGINALAEYTQISTGNGNYLGIMHNENTTLGNATPTGVAGDGDEVATGAQFYLRLIRNGATELKLERHATAARAGSILTTTRTVSMSAGLRYFNISHRSRSHSGRMDAKIENIKIWDNTVNPTKQDKSDLTNIEDQTIFEELDSGNYWWWNGSAWEHDGDYQHRGIFTGGYNDAVIDYITIQTQGNATKFGDRTGSVGRAGAAVGNGTYGIFGGDDNVLNYITISTPGNSLTFGSLGSTIGGNSTACADATRGVWAAYGSADIYYITMATLGNATDFNAHRQISGGDACGFADKTRGLFCGGEYNSGGWQNGNQIDFITIQTTGTCSDFGDLSVGKKQLSGVADSTYGYAMAGYNGGYSKAIDYVTIQTTGNGTDFGDLTQNRVAQNSACGDSTRAVMGGGHTGSANSNTMDYFTMGTTSGSGADFGDLTVARTRVCGCSDYVK